MRAKEHYFQIRFVPSGSFHFFSSSFVCFIMQSAMVVNAQNPRLAQWGEFVSQFHHFNDVVVFVN